MISKHNSTESIKNSYNNPQYYSSGNLWAGKSWNISKSSSERTVYWRKKHLDLMETFYTEGYIFGYTHQTLGYTHHTVGYTHHTVGYTHHTVDYTHHTV